MSENKSDVTREEKVQDEDKGEVLGNLVKVVVLFGLHPSHIQLRSTAQWAKDLDFDPPSSHPCFLDHSCVGLSPARNGSTPKKHLQQ